MILLPQYERQMIFADKAWSQNLFDSSREEQRLWITIAEWLEHFVPAQKIEIQFRKTDLVVDTKPWLQIFIGQPLTRDGTELIREKIDILFPNGETSGHFVSAVLVQLFGAKCERVHEVQSLDTAPASFTHAIIINADDDRWPVIFMRNSRGHNSEHARMPAARGDYNRCMVGIKLRGHFFFGGRKDLLLDFLTLAVLLVEEFGKLTCLGFVARQQESQ